MYSALLWTAVALYFGGTLLTIGSVVRRRSSLPHAALLALAAGLALHASSLAAQGAALGRFPVVDVQSALSVFGFLITLAFFLAYLRYRISALGIFMLPLVFVLTLISALSSGPVFQSLALRSDWLMIHIGCIMAGYAGFFVTFVAALMYLFQERQLKSRNPQALYYRLPSLEICDELYSRSLMFGLPFLTLGILTGFIWAAQTWHGSWELDPKILSALVTWIIYLFLFSARASGVWPGRKSAYAAIAGFAALMVTFVGASLLSGWHGYLPNLGNFH